MLTSTTTLNSS